ncbi:MAG: ExeA family protein [Acidobacteriota bacterium]
MYQEFYQLSEKPFSLSPNPKYLYFSESHQRAFNLIRYGIHEREAFIVITGDVGTGKTTLCRAVLETLDQNILTALVLNPFLSDEDLLKLILRDFGVIPAAAGLSTEFKPSTNDLIQALHQMLLSLQKVNAKAVLVIDEAQNLPLQTLEQIRILSNLESASEKLLQVILVGQPELDSILNSSKLRQLQQRVSIRFQLSPLSKADIQPYIYHRLAVAGCRKHVTFTPGALRLISKHTQGIPRLINLICDRSLMGGYAISALRIDRFIVKQALNALNIRPPRSYSHPNARSGWRRGLWLTSHERI